MFALVQTEKKGWWAILVFVDLILILFCVCACRDSKEGVVGDISVNP